MMYRCHSMLQQQQTAANVNPYPDSSENHCCFCPRISWAQECPKTLNHAKVDAQNSLLLWHQVGGTFWLTRLARDREAGVRVAAVSLLAHLASPQAPATRRMLLQGWPEAGTAMLKQCAVSMQHVKLHENKAKIHWQPIMP